MHISQFDRDDLIRHSSYKRGQFAQVGVKFAEEIVIQDSDGLTLSVVPGEPLWDDSEWALVTPDWIPDDELREQLFPG